jgi:hypothetical protein
MPHIAVASLVRVQYVSIMLTSRSARRPSIHSARAVLLATSAACTLLATLPAATDAVVRATSARTLDVTDTAHLHYRRESGSLLIDEGSATGALPGAVKVLFGVGSTIKATFTITTRAGSITGEGSAKAHYSGEYATFGGTMSVSHGTGRYAHAHGHGGVYGAINRYTYAATIQTTGNLSY